MANLVFFDKSHTYKLDGEELPSVSEIIRFISREVYGNIGQFTLDNAAERGTKIHKICEALDKYGSAEVPEDLTGYINSYVKFRQEHDVKWQKIEYAAAHPDGLYAGTIDRYGTVDGLDAIVDIKSSHTVQKQLAEAQLNLYRQIVQAPVDALYILHLKPDGYKLIDIPISDALSNACLTLHQALKKKPRKKKQEEENG